MEVHGEDAVRAGLGDEVGYELGGDGVAALGLAVLPRIAEVRDNGGDTPGGGALHRVDHDEQLHEAVVHGLAGGLDYKASAPRTGSLSSSETSPSAKAETLQSPSFLLSRSQMAWARGTLELPANTFTSLPCEINSIFLSLLLGRGPAPLTLYQMLHKNNRWEKKFFLARPEFP